MRGNVLTIQTSSSVWGNEAMMTWKTSPFIHTQPFTRGQAQPITLAGVGPSADSVSRGHVCWIRAMPMQITSWVSCSHHQTNPNCSSVYSTSSMTFPSQGFSDSSSTMFPGGPAIGVWNHRNPEVPASTGDEALFQRLNFLPLQWYHLHIWGCWYFSQ